eukprot:4387935-Pleurochrysis_carterae.AAC.2
MARDSAILMLLLCSTVGTDLMTQRPEIGKMRARRRRRWRALMRQRENERSRMFSGFRSQW